MTVTSVSGGVGPFRGWVPRMVVDFSRLKPLKPGAVPQPVVAESSLQKAAPKPRKKRVVVPFDPQKLPQMPQVFWEWLGGVLDGDGHLRLNHYRGGERSYAKMVIGMELADLALLQYARIGLGGHGSLQTAKGTFLLALTNQAALKYLVQQVGSHVRNTVRHPQLVEVCAHLGVSIPPTKPLTSISGWFPGFWDADGSITMRQVNRSVVFSISVSNVKSQDVAHFQEFFGGGVYSVAKGKGHSLHVWQINGRDDVLRFVTYAESAHFHSRKAHRLHMVKRGFALVDQRVHLDSHPEHNQWVKFRDEWDAVNVKDGQQRKVRRMVDASTNQSGRPREGPENPRP